MTSQSEIVLYSPRVSYYVGGGEKLPIIQAKELAQLGHNVHLVTQKVPERIASFLYAELKADRNAGVKIHEVTLSNHGAPHQQDPESDPSVWNTESLAFASATINLMQEIGPDAVLSYYLLDGLLRPHAGKNLVYLLGTPPEKLQLGIPMMNMYDADISISSVVQNHWRQYTSGNKPRFLLPSGVELPKQFEVESNDSKTEILFIGRLIERKGVATLLQAFKKVIQENASAHLTIAGDGPMRDIFEKLTGELQIQEQVSFIGFVNTEQLQRLYQAADFCVFPSYEGEGLLGVVLESMASAKAVIATTNNGNEDVITDRENGLLVEPRDVDSLAQSMNLLIKETEMTRTMGVKAREYVERNLTWQQHAKRLVEIINKIKQ